MKFKAGDNIIVIENDVKGTITGVTYNSINQCDEYVVKWETLPYEQTFPVDECDPIWERAPLPPNPLLPWIPDFSAYRGLADWKMPALNYIPITITIGDKITVQCNGHHTWKVYDSGFRRFEYCQHCNEERHEN